MIILSAQDSDKHINEVVIPFFNSFPTLESLVNDTEDDLFPIIGEVRNFGNKIKWILQIAKAEKEDSNIPLNLEELTLLTGIGRKSKNI